MLVSNDLTGTILCRLHYRPDRIVEIVVSDPAVKLGGLSDLVGRAFQPLVNLFRGLTPATDQALNQDARIGRQDEDRQRVCIQLPDLLRPLDFNIEQYMTS